MVLGPRHEAPLVNLLHCITVYLLLYRFCYEEEELRMDTNRENAGCLSHPKFYPDSFSGFATRRHLPNSQRQRGTSTSTLVVKFTDTIHVHGMIYSTGLKSKLVKFEIDVRFIQTTFRTAQLSELRIKSIHLSSYCFSSDIYNNTKYIVTEWISLEPNILISIFFVLVV